MFFIKYLTFLFTKNCLDNSKMSIPWLYEEINKIQAVQLLKQNHEGDGSFLVRTNLIRDNEYVLYVYKKYFNFYYNFIILYNCIVVVILNCKIILIFNYFF